MFKIIIQRLLNVLQMSALFVSPCAHKILNFNKYYYLNISQKIK